MHTYLSLEEEVIHRIEADLMTFDLSEISRITGVPSGLYQRFFSYSYGISIASYIRKRKLTVAASKLLLKEWSVTSAAFECGYEDSSSFSRAFKEQFTVSPTTLTVDAFESHKQERLTHTTISKDLGKTTEILSIEYVQLPSWYLVGISSERYSVTGHDLWQIYWQHNIDKQLYQLEIHQTGSYSADYSAIGFMTDFEDSGSLGRKYRIGRLFKDKPAVAHDLDMHQFDAMTFAHARISAASLNDIIEVAYPLTCELAKKNGFAIQYKPFFWLEYYNKDWLDADKDNEHKRILDFYLPCQKTRVTNGGLQCVANEN